MSEDSTGFDTRDTFFDESGVAKAVATYNHNGSYDTRLYLPGDLWGLPYASSDTAVGPGHGWLGETWYDQNGAVLAVETPRSGGGVDVQFNTSGSLWGLPYASYDLTLGAAYSPTQETWYDHNGVAEAVKTWSQDGSYVVNFNTPGDLSGLSYNSYNLSFTSADVHTQESWYGQGGTAVATETFHPDGGYDINFFASGYLGGLSYASLNVAYNSRGQQTQESWYDQNGVAEAVKTVRQDGGFDISAHAAGTAWSVAYASLDSDYDADGALTQQTWYDSNHAAAATETYHNDSSFDVRIFQSGAISGASFSSYDLGYTAVGFHNQTSWLDANGHVVASQNYT